MSVRVNAVILAAGKGTRMKSSTPKVLHELCGKTMLDHVILTVAKAGVDPQKVAVVISPELEDPLDKLYAGALHTVVQSPQNGTGHAVQLALDELPGDDPVLIVNADMPLLTDRLLGAVIDVRARTKAAVAMLTVEMAGSTFGRIIRKSGRPVRIIEHSDATPDERLITEVNAGVYCFDLSALRGYLTKLRASNVQKELYLTDCIQLAVESGALVEAVTTRDRGSALGVNTLAELATVRNVMRRRILRSHMLAGVSVVDPATTYVDIDVDIAPDVTLFPQTRVLGSSVVGANSRIGPNTTLHNATIGKDVTITYSVVRDSAIARGATVGPFAHIRGGSQIQEDARIGNFVEVKNTTVGRKAKASHLAYLGDAEIGDEANIGAGTITCNYDGARKNKTKVGRRALIGSNSSLVAPVEIGDGALTGAGSVVTHDVPAGERVAGNPARPLPKKEQTKKS
jgi:bifunctional UDP-N-acetylglucosamine pyrophosphorylase/glucosamine-1-phosphate N-acetyltransferase